MEIYARFNLLTAQGRSQAYAHSEQGAKLVALLEDTEQAKFPVYPWTRQIANQVANLFFCKYYYMRMYSGKQATHVFVGKASNAATAQYMADFVVRSVMREAAKMYGSAIAPDARNFAIGVVSKLHDRIRVIKEAFNKQEPSVAGTALVLASLYEKEAKANEAWLKEMGTTLVSGVSRQKDVTNSSAFMAGRDFGNRVSLSAQVGSTKNNTKRLAR